MRSLRAALWRFAELAHCIRPHKGKAYISNLVPCIVKIVERNEEQLHECLVSSLQKILKALGCFTTDTDVKVNFRLSKCIRVLYKNTFQALLKAFFGNIGSPSAVTRRSAASCILTICLNCRKPPIFINYVANNVTGLYLLYFDLLK